MNFLFLVIICPVLGFVILAYFQQSLSKRVVSIVGISSVSCSTLIVGLVLVDFFNQITVTSSRLCIQSFFKWISIDNFVISVSFRIDELSLSMLLMITIISLLIHIYASWYMFDHARYSLFFAYMNLFVANMILLILADNLLLMYFGWEGVGLCSYLLINFYYTDLKHGRAALKAFIMTRIGDIFLICAMFMLYKHFHTLDFCNLIEIFSKKSFDDLDHQSLSVITFFILVAAIAKSAQFPLHTWLLDAMVAPSPVSALIHAATMVTAGVYLIARTDFLFMMTPEILYLVGVIGSITLIMSTCLALVQDNIKKILAYSTISQIGYMFIALSVQARYEAVFHLIIHAFFKALLFLASGSLIFVCRGEQNIFKMGGLYKSVPLIYVSFLIGGAALSTIPLITSSFYSKGEIFWKVALSGNNLFMFVCILGSCLTVFYTFRMIFVIFHDNNNIINGILKYSNSFFHYFPLVILSILSTVIGACVIFFIFSNDTSLLCLQDFNKLLFECFLSILVIFCFCLSIIYYLFSRRIFINTLMNNCVMGKYFFRFCFIGWGLDDIYKRIFVMPYLFIARLLSSDPINVILNFVVLCINFFSGKLILSENGQLRYYITSMLFGVTIIFFILVFL